MMACASLVLVLSHVFERNVLKPLESCTVDVVCKRWFWSVPLVGGLCWTWSHMQHTSPQSSTLESWFVTLVVEACTAENNKSLKFLNCICGSVHGTHF